jgi:hypothetical protein
VLKRNRFFFTMAQQPPKVPRPPHCRGFMITPTHTTLDRIPLDEWSVLHRDLYLTTHNRHSSMPRRDSNPQSQQASGRRLTPQTARPLEPANRNLWLPYSFQTLGKLGKVLRTVNNWAFYFSPYFFKISTGDVPPIFWRYGRVGRRRFGWVGGGLTSPIR